VRSYTRVMRLNGGSEYSGCCDLSCIQVFMVFSITHSFPFFLSQLWCFRHADSFLFWNFFLKNSSRSEIFLLLINFFWDRSFHIYSFEVSRSFCVPKFSFQSFHIFLDEFFLVKFFFSTVLLYERGQVKGTRSIIQITWLAPSSFLSYDLIW